MSVNVLYKPIRCLLVAVAITIILVANTGNAALVSVSSGVSRNVSNTLTREGSSSRSADTGRVTDTSSGQPDRRKIESAFLDLWKLSASDGNKHGGNNERGSFGIEDSMMMVIGVNNAQPRACGELAEAIAQVYGKIIKTVLIQNKIVAVVANVPSAGILELGDIVQAAGLARYAEPRIRFQAQFIPNDPYWLTQWGPTKIEADNAWDTTLGSHDVLVAVIDTGIDYNHPDLAANYMPLGRDWVNEDNDPLDDNGHGTHCAGIVAAVINNTKGIAGLANVSIMAEKGIDFSGGGWDDDLANAIIHAVDQGADILSNSWGGTEESYLIRDAIQYAHSQGVVIIAAAGNSASNTKSYPAAYDEVIGVTATDQFDAPASFTSFGDWVEVAAPGVNVYSTLPTYHVTLNDPPYSRTQNYDYLSGTSMACPHVVGEAALIKSRFPNATSSWIRVQLRSTADDRGNPGFDDYFGYGRINAKKAVENAPPDHDLLIFKHDEPKLIQPGQAVTLSFDILDFGENDEDNVMAQLLVDSNVTSSTVISHIASGSLASVSLAWNPSAEGEYNVTLYVVPVPGEMTIGNNNVTMSIKVKTVVAFVLFDQSHLSDPMSGYSIWTSNLTNRGYAIDAYEEGEITPELLAGYDIFVVAQAGSAYSQGEITALQDFVLNGGGLLVIGDQAPWSYTEITSFAGITWNYESMLWYGSTVDITSHSVTQGVISVYFGWPRAYLNVSTAATDLVRGGPGIEAMLAVSQMGDGRVIGLADQDTINDQYIPFGSNLALANNIIDWLAGEVHEHELAVRLDAPSYLEPGQASFLNATVRNRGLSNETNVDIQLIINGTIVSNVTVVELVKGAQYTLSHAWTAPNLVAAYNVTAYAPPVSGENMTGNNGRTRLISVHYPLIKPIEGQYANYTLAISDDSGYVISTGSWNISYERYVEPYRMYVKLAIEDPTGMNITGALVVNTMTRFVESGIWAGMWYPGWIETDVGLGTTISFMGDNATVNGTGTLVPSPRAVECWEVPYTVSGVPYTFCYDKTSGLWISMKYGNTFAGLSEEMLLEDTNVPIGVQRNHDLGVKLKAPLHLQPNETTILTVTMYNLGLRNETNAVLELFINNTIVAPIKVIPLFVNGSSYDMNYSWTPSTRGSYNVTVYALPRAGESVIVNNALSRMVYASYVEVALISESSELMTIAPILNSIGVGYDLYNYNGWMGSRYTEDPSLLLKYKAVLLFKDGGQITSNEFATLSSYLSKGGNLLVTGSGALASDSLMANLVRSSSTGSYSGSSDFYVTENTHPIVNGPFGAFPIGYHVTIPFWFANYDKAKADTSQNAVTVAGLTGGEYDKIIATKGLPGKVVFWNGEGEYDWTLNNDCKAMLKNTIYWFTVKFAHDISVSLRTPKFLELGQSTKINATILNEGLNAETNVEAGVLINDAIIENITIVVLLSGESRDISFSWTPQRIGRFNVTAHAMPVAGENDTGNNVMSKTVVVAYAPRILAYMAYVDVFQEFPNMLRAIESAFGPNYVLTEFWDYTQLESLLPGKDILLIPDQHYTSLPELEAIGNAWSQTLTVFLENGGIMIVCDGGWGYGTTYGILTGAGFMQISGTNPRTDSTLRLVNSSDPLAEGLSSSFAGPSHTVSFVATDEANTIVSDGTYPVVIHKRTSPGHIVLLGFDFESSNEDTQRLLGNTVAQSTYVMISVNPTAGSPAAEVALEGELATKNGTLRICWDGTNVGNTTANSQGEFSYILTIPENATIGIHTIGVVDASTGKSASKQFRVFTISSNPSEGPVGTRTMITGTGFVAGSQMRITFNDMFVGYATAGTLGEIAFIFNVPVSVSGTQTIKAVDAQDNEALTEFSVLDMTPLTVSIDVGAMYFRGESAEFYVQTTFKGLAVDATITNASLRKPDGTTESLTGENVALGLFKLQYTIPGNALQGTYTLVANASYITGSSRSIGTSLKCFLVSPTLTSMNLTMQEIRGDIATIVIPSLGIIKANLTAINASIVSIDGQLATLSSTLGMVQASLDTINLEVVAVNGTEATIQTSIGELKGLITLVRGDTATIIIPHVGAVMADIGKIAADTESLRGTEQTWSMPQSVIVLALALVAAVCSAFSLVILRRRKTPELPANVETATS